MNTDDLVQELMTELGRVRNARTEAEADARVIEACKRPRTREEQQRIQDQLNLLDAEKAWYRLGVVLSAQGAWTEAAQWLRKAAECHYGDASIRLARVLDRLGDTTQAAHWRAVADDAGFCDDDLDDLDGLAEQTALVPSHQHADTDAPTTTPHRPAADVTGPDRTAVSTVDEGVHVNRAEADPGSILIRPLTTLETGRNLLVTGTGTGKTRLITDLIRRYVASADPLTEHDGSLLLPTRPRLIFIYHSTLAGMCLQWPKHRLDAMWVEPIWERALESFDPAVLAHDPQLLSTFDSDCWWGSHTVVEDAMTPWKDTVTIPDGSTVDHALGIALRHSVRRMPVVNHDGHVTGVVHLDDLARELHEHRGTPSIRRVESLQRTPAYASARRSAGDVAEAMHQSGVHTAIVLDRHKRPVGLVTLGQLRRTRPHHEANLFTTTQPGLMPGPRDTTVARRLHVRSHMSTICAERTTALRL